MTKKEKLYPCRLYLITPPDIGGKATKKFSEILEATLNAGDIACVQLRLKDSDDALRRTTEKLMPLVQKYDVAFILNDNVKIAAEFGCDGIHIGQSDMPYEKARKMVGDHAIVGVTCHDSTHLAMQASEAGADYVAFGAFFKSSTKVRRFTPKINILTDWSETTTVPCVAIGGITVKNCETIIRAGADFIAVSNGVWGYKDGPEAAVKIFNNILVG
ncbi:MAG: thiamine phosphate synthase [Rhodospirillaceae bacterium]|nr:thiamine phosphate synthase [Rhodospirillaceae bacterium]|tara:strand:- start:2083 stop:2730 length:648 start_codon:yes stop_codon:yes gene_type:complete